MSARNSNSSSHVNPFYIEPNTNFSNNDNSNNNDKDEWAWDDDDDDDDGYDDYNSSNNNNNNNMNNGWQNDTDDLDDLLENDSPGGWKDSDCKLSNTNKNKNGNYNDGYNDDDASKRKLAYLGTLAIFLVVALIAMKKKGDAPKSSSSNHTHNNQDRVERIVILGERHSGLPWLHDVLQECYSKQAAAKGISISTSLSRPGMFFQDLPESQSESKTPSQSQQRTLVVATFTNVYDWVQDMRLYPQYAPRHNHTMSWKTYLKTPWTMERPQQDLDALQRFEQTGKGGDLANYCQMHFFYNQVVPCVVVNVNDGGGDTVDNDNATNTDHNNSSNTDQPVYEMNRTFGANSNGLMGDLDDDQKNGLPYESILDLRADKIRNFVQEVGTWDFVSNVIPVQHESLTKNMMQQQQQQHQRDENESDAIQRHTEWVRLLQQINEETGMEAMEDCFKSANVVDTELETNEHKHSNEASFVEYINQHVNWTAEALVGYEKWDAKDTVTDPPVTDPPVATPVTDAPVTDAPVATPVTDPPVTDAPVAAPVTKSPVTKKAPTPVTKKGPTPVTNAPTPVRDAKKDTKSNGKKDTKDAKKNTKSKSNKNAKDAKDAKKNTKSKSNKNAKDAKKKD